MLGRQLARHARARARAIEYGRRLLSSLIVEEAGPVTTLSIDSGPRNAMTEGVLSELEIAIGALSQKSSSCRVVVLRGRGGHLTAGGDMTMLSDLPPLPISPEADPLATQFRRFGDLFLQLSELPQAVVTCIDGVGIGGGLGLMCSSDIVVATSRSRFGLPEVKAGFVPAQPMPFVVRRIGISHATRLAVSGALVTADEAQRMGLVHVVCGDGASALEAAVDEQVASVLRASPSAIRAVKGSLLRLGGHRYSETGKMLDECTAVLAESLRGADAAEGIGAFKGKRDPTWVVDWPPAGARPREEFRGAPRGGG
jgi:isohexenylglutaconyl-CoA hydratase